jgi:hypothetical protein
MPVVTTGLTADDCDYAMIQNANYIIQNCIPSLTCSSLMVDATSGTAPIDGTAVFLATFLHAGTVAIALDKGAVDLNPLQDAIFHQIAHFRWHGAREEGITQVQFL